MKVINLGGKLEGFSRQERTIAAGLKEMAGDERVVIVSHGMPLRQGSVDFLREVNLHAILLAQSGSAASPEQLAELRSGLAGECARVYGLMEGWDNLYARDGETGKKILDFLASEDEYPADKDVQRLLGFDSPVARLALRVALEIALRELEKERENPAAERRMSLEQWLSPAMRMGQRDSSLSEVVEGIGHALSHDRTRVMEEVSSALAILRDDTAQRN